MQKPILIPIGLAALSLAWKAYLLSQDAFPFNADEAIVGLMARHMLDGQWPLFFYGQAYMGSLDAALVAGIFALIGSKVIGIRIVQAFLYAGTVFTTVILARRILGTEAAGNTAGLLLVFPTVNVMLYSTVSLGGYGEALLVGNMLLILTLAMIDKPQRIARYALWGVLAGLGFWAFGLTLIYIIPAGILLLRFSIIQAPKKIQSLLLTLMGFVLGSTPWWWWALKNGPALVTQELLGSAIAGASSVNLLEAIGSHVFNLLLFGPTVMLGFRPPWSVHPLAGPLIPIAVILWIAFAANEILDLRRLREWHRGKALLYAVSAMLVLGFVLTPFGGDPSGRYFVPLAIPFAILLAGFLAKLRRRFGDLAWLAALAFVITFNLWGTLQSVNQNPPGLTTQFNQATQIDHSSIDELVAFLAQRGELVGYTNYWVSYPLAFLSEEQVIYVPQLPYHLDFRYTERDDRYSPYADRVAQGSQIAYITTRHPALDAKLRDAFVAAGVTWQERSIGDYQVLFALSDVIRPSDIGLINSTEN